MSLRDLEVLRSIASYRFLTTKQVQSFHFMEHATDEAAARVCRRVLQRLDVQGVIERTGRRQGGVRGGSEATIWRIGGVGNRILALRDGYGSRARRKEPSSRFLAHCLDVAETHLTLLTLSRSNRLQLLDVTSEPQSWRTYLGPGGERLTLKPDLLASTVAGEFEDRWAFEIDEGTESIPTLLRKCRQYEAYRRSGREQQEHGVFPLVVWIVPTAVRASRLLEAIDRTPGIEPKIFRVCTPAELATVIDGGAA